MTVREFTNSRYFDDFFGDIDFSESGNDYIFSTNIGGLHITFNLDNCKDIIPLYKEDKFISAHEMEEFYGYTVKKMYCEVYYS